jgi:hypothetical protein
MAYDPVIETGLQPVAITLGGTAITYKPGDLIGYSGGFVKANATNGSVIAAELICGQFGVSGDVVTAYRSVTVYDADAPYAVGALEWLGKTAGTTTETMPPTTGDLDQCLGFAVSTSRVCLDCQYGGAARPTHA